MDLPSQRTFEQLEALLVRETPSDPNNAWGHGSPLIPHALLGELPTDRNHTSPALGSRPASPAMRQWLAPHRALRMASRATSPAPSPGFPPFHHSAPQPPDAPHHFASHPTLPPPLDNPFPTAHHHLQPESNVRSGPGGTNGASPTRTPPSRANTLSPLRSPSASAPQAHNPSPNSFRPATAEAEERPPDPWDTALRTAGTQSGLFSAQEKHLLNNFLSELEWAFHPDLPEHLPTLHPPPTTQPPFASSHSYSYPYPSAPPAPPVPPQAQA